MSDKDKEKKKEDEKKENLGDKSWEGSDEDEDEEEEKNEEKKKEEPKKIKQELIRDKNGEVLITKLDDYIEPEKKIKEAKGDIRDANIYNFASLVKAEADEEEENEKKEEVKEEKKEEEKEEEKNEGKKKKKTPPDLESFPSAPMFPKAANHLSMRRAANAKCVQTHPAPENAQTSPLPLLSAPIRPGAGRLSGNFPAPVQSFLRSLRQFSCCAVPFASPSSLRPPAQKCSTNHSACKT